MTIRPMRDDERDSVAQLIHLSTNQWYEQNRGHSIFNPQKPESCRLFTDVYEDLDPGCCLVAEHPEGWLAGSCFYHPRDTHMSLGIMNVHPDAFGMGVAVKLLSEIRSLAAGLPIRLISSALNLDSYSLYTRSGFTPHTLYQDMQFPENASMANIGSDLKIKGNIRPATIEDVATMTQLEMELTGIHRQQDYLYFIKNKSGTWKTLVHEEDGIITGFLSSVNHPASQMLGPGICRHWKSALALIIAHHQDIEHRPVFLVPAKKNQLVNELYQRGARNLELHVSQIHGKSTTQTPGSVILPTFMPETG